ncbi:unnamed protein product [Paramecium octaurelia]|uniref:Transmembrane protein n=1 Tax=Paramecium octaurelia TaxID=43137 RepID=A0A8S1XCZ9_PAROT|nr:unnamed protein product [Paramecium octaurelia]CAD8199140.1 unnamed protein product [Paramecium octaurelia]
MKLNQMKLKVQLKYWHQLQYLYLTFFKKNVSFIYTNQFRAPKHYAFLSNISMCLYISCWISQYCFQVQQINLNTDNFKLDDYSTYLALTIGGGSLFILSFLFGLFRACILHTSVFWGQLCCLTFGQTLITIGMGFGQTSKDVYGQIDFTFNYPVAEFIGICGIFVQALHNCYEHSLDEDSK